MYRGTTFGWGVFWVPWISCCHLYSKVEVCVVWGLDSFAINPACMSFVHPFWVMFFPLKPQDKPKMSTLIFLVGLWFAHKIAHKMLCRSLDWEICISNTHVFVNKIVAWSRSKSSLCSWYFPSGSKWEFLAALKWRQQDLELSTHPQCMSSRDLVDFVCVCPWTLPYKVGVWKQPCPLRRTQ